MKTLKLICKFIISAVLLGNMMILSACSTNRNQLSETDHDYYTQQIHRDLVTQATLTCNGDILTVQSHAKIEVRIEKYQHDDSKSVPAMLFHINMRHTVTQPSSQFTASLILRYEQTDQVWGLRELMCVA